MRHLERTDKPQQLIDNAENWTANFILSGLDRPNYRQYGHIEIKEALGNISFNKCFYSEVKFPHLNEAQVDHYIEVSEDKAKAFEWENLYLSHKNSNQGKITNRRLPNSHCLNPFTDNDDEIESSLYFEDEVMLGRDEKGLNTIKKYHLYKDLYNILRAKELQKFYKILEAIYLSIQNNEMKNEASTSDLASLKSFANPDRPFSLMFKLLLKERYNLL